MTKVYSLSKFTMNKRTLLLNPSDCSSHGVFSESSGNDPFLSVGGGRSRMDTGHSDKGRFRARPIPGGKEHTSIQSSPKMRVKNSGYSLFNSKGRNPGKLCQLEAPLWKFQVHQANHSQMEGSQIGISFCFKTSVKRPKFCN